MTLSQIGQIAIVVQDVDRAVAFYRDVLGMTFLFRAGNLAFFDCGGIRLMLDRLENPSECYSSILYYKVDDIQRDYEALSQLGVHFEQKPHRIARMPDHDLWMAFFRDSERNLAGLMCEVRPPAAE
jgi:catechol 2,3-dioxygenase-like lactoylglutathione lyase family enzyme